jgi:hypothetical protein
MKKKRELRVLQTRTLRQREWERPVHRGYYLSCCGCGLTHRVNFRVVEGQVEFQMFRAPRATAVHRKRFWKKILERVEDMLDGRG